MSTCIRICRQGETQATTADERRAAIAIRVGSCPMAFLDHDGTSISLPKALIIEVREAATIEEATGMIKGWLVTRSV